MLEETLCDLFRMAVETHKRPNAFREYREDRWVDVSADTYAEDVAAVGEALVERGFEPGDRVALLAENRYFWAVADMASLARGGVVVPIYPTLTAAQVGEILEDSGAKWIFTSSGEQAEKVLEIGALLKDIGAIVVFDEFEAANPALVSMGDLMASGREKLAANGVPPLETIHPTKPEDLATIIYTSGTTGRPKGVMLSHSNIVSNVRAALDIFDITGQDACLSFLPLSHVFERMAGYYTMLYQGVSIAYARAIETVAEDALTIRPTILIGVPRFFEKFHARVMDAIEQAPPLRKKLFRWAESVGCEVAERQHADLPISRSLQFKRNLAGALVFRKLKARIGGRARFFVSGGAALRPDINLFFHGVGIPIFEGYGLTETSPVITANTQTHCRIGSVGKPIPGVEVKIAADGEILTRGPNVMSGYYNKDDETAAVFRSDWFCTGDIGHIDEDGYLFITDRKKDLFVTAAGKNVAPLPIEQALKRSRFVGEAMLIGDGRRFLSAIIVPDFIVLEATAKAEGITFENFAELVTHAAVKSLYDSEVAAVNDDLANYETIKKFVVLSEEWTIPDGALTPTLKVKRRIIEERHADLIDALYAE